MHNDPKGDRSTRNAASTRSSASASGDARTRGRARPFKEAINLRLTDPARTNKHDRASAVPPGKVPGNPIDAHLEQMTSLELTRAVSASQGLDSGCKATEGSLRGQEWEASVQGKQF